MPIRVSCPTCGSTINAPDKAAGKSGKCPKCGSMVAIPKPEGDLPNSQVINPEPSPAPVVAKKPVPEKFDVEIDDDFDVDIDIDDNPPAPKAAPVVAAPAPVVAAPATVAPPIGNPFADFAPPPDSAAAKFDFGQPDPVLGDDEEPPVKRRRKSASEDVDEPAPSSREPMHPGWESVLRGLNMMKFSVIVFIVVLLSGGISGLLIALKLPMILFWIGGGMSLLMLLISAVMLTIGLFHCQKAPQPKQGGPGPQMAQFAFYAVLGAILLSACGGSLIALALPFLIGAFLRAVGNALPHPSTTKAATRYMIATGVGFVISLLCVIVPVGLIIGLRNSLTISTASWISNCSAAFNIFTQLLVTVLLFLTLSGASQELTKQIKLRKIAKPSPKKDDHEEEDD
jgi:hypothetical protein